jgi:hypothetical protein
MRFEHKLRGLDIGSIVINDQNPLPHNHPYHLPSLPGAFYDKYSSRDLACLEGKSLNESDLCQEKPHSIGLS